MYLRIKKYLSKIITRRAESLKITTDERARNKEFAKFDQIWLKVIIIVVIFAIGARVLDLITPAQDIAIDISQNPNDFHPISTARVFSSNKSSPPFSEKDIIESYNISLPNFKQLEIQKLLKRSSFFWYEINVSIPPELFKPEQLSILLPPVWGRSVIFQENHLMTFGKDIRAMLPLQSPTSKIYVKVDAWNAVRFGFRSTYAPLWGEPELLQKIPERVNQQKMAFPGSEMVHLIIALLFSIMFISSGRKPEVFAFIIYTLISWIYYLTLSAKLNNIITPFPPVIIDIVQALSAILRALTLYWFVLEFTRKSKKEIFSSLFLSIISVATFAFMFSLVWRMISGTHLLVIFQPTQEICFMILSCVAFIDAANLLIRDQRNKTWWRIGGFSIIVIAILVSQILLISDYVNAQTKITSEHIRNIFAFILAAGVVLFEFSRKEKEHNNIVMSLENNYMSEIKKHESLAAIGKFAKLLAHDVRKPFTQIKILLTMFDTLKNDPILLEKSKKDTEKALKTVDSMISDILVSSREEKLITTSGNILDTIHNALNQVALDNFQDSNVRILVHYDFKHTHKALIDQEHITRVFNNIFGNAVEAISILGNKELGNIFISTKTKEPDSKASNQRTIEIFLGNDGPLLDKNDIPKLFNTTFTKGKNKGTGLGLASVANIVKLHGGSIFVRNKSTNDGVEFIINLPSSAIIESEYSPGFFDSMFLKSLDDFVKTNHSSIDLQITSSINTIANKGPFKILLLEDEPLYRAAIKNLISSNKLIAHLITIYDVSTVSEALAVGKSFDVTHGVIDIDLGKDQSLGFDFLTKIKSINPDFKSLIHTNRTQDEDIVLAQKLGASGFVSKPLTIFHLVKFLSGDKLFLSTGVINEE